MVCGKGSMVCGKSSMICGKVSIVCGKGLRVLNKNQRVCDKRLCLLADGESLFRIADTFRPQNNDNQQQSINHQTNACSVRRGCVLPFLGYGCDRWRNGE
jgi:hypothetical protein